MVSRSYKQGGQLEIDFQIYLASNIQIVILLPSPDSCIVKVTEVSEYAGQCICNAIPRKKYWRYFTSHNTPVTLTLASGTQTKTMTSRHKRNSARPVQVPTINETPHARPGLCVSINPTQPPPPVSRMLQDRNQRNPFVSETKHAAYQSSGWRCWIIVWHVIVHVYRYSHRRQSPNPECMYVHDI
jgi:hypothetical protein